jgi:hypothetical protein
MNTHNFHANHIINKTKQKEEPGGTKDIHILHNWTSGGHPRGKIGEV